MNVAEKQGFFVSKSKPNEAPKPVKRRDVLMPCPIDGCGSEPLRWTCLNCQDVLEYGLEDGCLYCECGMAQLTDCQFKCDNHELETANQHRLRGELGKLNPLQEMNILIMGETGVGKSTFINAFANYLTYSTIEEALQGASITLIPNQFYITDENYQEVCIQNGEVTSEENLGVGQSATQATKVHRFDFGETIVRIIDTPGVGDVRGTLKDNENFKNILDTIASLDVIHGIIILLKPNQARLNVTFRYCIQELLTHLHKSAVENIIFGFTNSRSTNFRPGDTLPPLRQLLSNQSVGIDLGRKNIYCFDSESYRFLSALNHGLIFDEDLIDSFSKSWKYSVKETERLISYIQILTPHMTKQTLSVNNARILILQLTRPMAEITRTIMKNVDYLQQLEQIVKDVDEENQDLLKDLMIEKIDLVPKDLGHPRTVCTNSACVEISDVDGHKQTNYVTWCHDHCYLEGIQVETTKNPGLIHCAAMSGNNCTKCTHHYTEHMHITYELQEQLVKVEDHSKKSKHAKNMTFLEEKAAKLAEVRDRQKEYKQEYRAIEKIAAKFGAFLKHNAITPYSDARLEYLQFLIDEEKKRPEDVRDKKLLASLEEAKDIYTEEVSAIEKAIKAGQGQEIKDPGLIEKLIDNLFNLRHFGKSLERIKNTAVKCSPKSYNEKSHRYTSLSKKSPLKKALSFFGIK